MDNTADDRSIPRRALWALAAQMMLTAATVFAAALTRPGRAAMVVVMLLTVMNGLVVAFAHMGIRRDGWWSSRLAVLTLVLLVGLLIWPAWDVSHRAPWF